MYSGTPVTNASNPYFIINVIYEESVHMEDLLKKSESEENPETKPNTYYLKRYPAISLHAIIGCLNLNTTRVKGKIENYWVVILIDTRSTHNFVDPVIVKKNIRLGVNTEKKNHVSN